MYRRFGWLVVLGLNDPLRQYFSLYRVVSQREGEREEKGQMRVKMSKQPPPAPTARAVGPCPTLIQTSRTPRHWKFTQDHRTTRPPPCIEEEDLRITISPRETTTTNTFDINPQLGIKESLLRALQGWHTDSESTSFVLTCVFKAPKVHSF